MAAQGYLLFAHATHGGKSCSFRAGNTQRLRIAKLQCATQHAVTMSRVSDLVQDAELQTRFHPEYTVHIYTETGSSVRERAILREEYWKRQKFLGGGSYGSVWLEQCVEGEREVKVRAVKEVVKSPHASKQVDHNRELEAISKFSHRKVSSSILWICPSWLFIS